MNDLWTSEAIAKATGGTASADFAVTGVAFDSREAGAGDLFFALKGEESDGHQYLEQVYANGAAGAVVSDTANGAHVIVQDTTEALNALARASRSRTEAKIIGVTGSVGKTGTKEALYAALARSSHGKAHRSVKSYNNHVGVPLSLTRMPADSAYGIFEMGMNHPGELSELTQLVRPDVAVITTIAPAHAGFFDSVEQIADSKAEIFEGLAKAGTAIIPFDSPYYKRLKTAALKYTNNIISFGVGKGADVRAVDIVPAVGGGSLVTASLGDKNLCFTISAPGAHWVVNALAILGVVQAVGGDLAAAGLALAELEGLDGRGKRHQIATSDGGTALLIDESYNANPASMKATLATLAAENCTGKKIAILGAMGELGDTAQKYHEALADDVAASSAAVIILLGDEMAHTKTRLEQMTLEPNTQIFHAASADAALSAVQPFIANGDIILVKGSNYLGLAKTVSALTDLSGAKPAAAKEL